MIVNGRVALRGLGGLNGDPWDDWCAQKYANDPVNAAKCIQKPWGPLTLAPWTDVGASQRGLPKDSLLNTLLTGGTAPAIPATVGTAPIMDEGLFGIPKTILIAGGATLLVGVGALYLKKKMRKGRR